MPDDRSLPCQPRGNASHTTHDTASRNCSTPCQGHQAELEKANCKRVSWDIKEVLELDIYLDQWTQVTIKHGYLQMACTIMVSTLSGENLSLYRERLCAKPRAMAVMSRSGRPEESSCYWMMLQFTLQFATCLWSSCWCGHEFLA